MVTDRKSRLQEFVAWSAAHITGDEKGQAQIFLDRLFQAFGRKGLLEVGGQPEFRIRKSKEDGGGTAFADYVWKPLVLVEMKKRGTDCLNQTCALFSARSGIDADDQDWNVDVGNAAGLQIPNELLEIGYAR